MSSPFSSLDKTKKSPSNPSRSFGKRSMPFRSVDYVKEQELLDDLEEQMTLQKISSSSKSSIDLTTTDKITPQKLLSPISSPLSPLFNPLGSAAKSPVTKASAPSDIELLSTMMKRITQLEKQTAYYSKEIIEKNKRIKILEEKLSLLTKAKELRESQDPTKVEEIEAKCTELQQQIYEMETFLADYGMIWVGDRSDPFSENYVDEDKDIAPVVPVNLNQLHSVSSRITNNDFKVDFDLIVHNVKDLNIIAGEGVSKIEKTKDGARLKVQESVPLTLYANGIAMFSGPFRPYTDMTTRRCVGDLMDGYFPTELQKKYPDGVPLQVTDKRNVVFKDPRNSKSFPGVGRLLQDNNAPESDDASELTPRPLQTSETTAKVQTDSEYEVTSQLPGPKMSVEQFLQKLPKSVIRDGKIMEIRSSLKTHLASDSSNERSDASKNVAEVIETEVVLDMQKRMNMPAATRPISARNVTTIRVKCEDGVKTYILKMRFSDTIRDLHRYIDAQRPRHAAPYEVISTFPHQKHTDASKTLEECGLIPNATLHLKPKK